MIIHFNVSKVTLITIAQHVLWIYKNADGKMYVLNGRCPHKGGPLYLGEIKNLHIICPWHETRISLKKLIDSSYPSVFVGDCAKLVFEDKSNPSITYRCLPRCVSF